MEKHQVIPHQKGPVTSTKWCLSISPEQLEYEPKESGVRRSKAIGNGSFRTVSIVWTKTVLSTSFHKVKELTVRILNSVLASHVAIDEQSKTEKLLLSKNKDNKFLNTISLSGKGVSGHTDPIMTTRFLIPLCLLLWVTLCKAQLVTRTDPGMQVWTFSRLIASPKRQLTSYGCVGPGSLNPGKNRCSSFLSVYYS